MSDGLTANSLVVAVRLTDAGVEIATPDTPPRLWPYASLTTAEPIRRASTDTLISSTEMPGATLFVEGLDFTRHLKDRADHLGVTSLRWRYAKPGLAVAAIVVLLSLAVWYFDLTPARTVASWLPDPVRVRMGQQVIVSMGEDRPVCHTDDGRAALDKMATRLSQATGATSKFSVTVLDWELLNAFAAPGSQIVLTREIIRSAKSADEVAGVLAHEMGHGLELHPETALVRAIGLSAAIELMSGGSSGTLANMGAILMQLNYSRIAEREADSQAVRILQQAKISPKGFADFFRRISAMEGDSLDDGKNKDATDKNAKPDEGKTDASKPDDAKTDAAKDDAKTESSYTRYLSTDLIRTHPQSRERLKQIEAIPAYDSTPALTDAEWSALRDICKYAKRDKTKHKS